MVLADDGQPAGAPPERVGGVRLVEVAGDYRSVDRRLRARPPVGPAQHVHVLVGEISEIGIATPRTAGTREISVLPLHTNPKRVRAMGADAVTYTRITALPHNRPPPAWYVTEVSPVTLKGGTARRLNRNRCW